MTERESALVELVDEHGSPAGAVTVARAHDPPGRLHRAFSVIVVDPDGGDVLLQRRAAAKTRFPLRWANACCGHPAPGESPAVAAGRRIGEELGPVSTALTEVDVFRYRATDPMTGLVEHEYDHVLLGYLPRSARFAPDPAEVAELRWVGREQLRRELAENAGSFAPWVEGVTRFLLAAPD
ncbi:MAG TPA: isopentenyl-diphosphate Delta-isomerase [Micromonosporaceae bacterium]|nr:isopentenyl-diphosphate Delta-isomerase [Micromonosporaceae bacterium]